MSSDLPVLHAATALTILDVAFDIYQCHKAEQVSSITDLMLWQAALLSSYVVATGSLSQMLPQNVSQAFVKCVRPQVIPHTMGLTDSWSHPFGSTNSKMHDVLQSLIHIGCAAAMTSAAQL